MSAETTRLLAAIRSEMDSVSATENNGFQMRRTLTPLLEELETEIAAIEEPEEEE